MMFLYYSDGAPRSEECYVSYSLTTCIMDSNTLYEGMCVCVCLCCHMQVDTEQSVELSTK